MSSILSTLQLDASADSAAQSKLDRLKSKAETARDKSDAEIWAVAEGFEAMLTNIMLKAMRSSGDGENTFLGESFQGSMYKDMYYSELANVTSQRHDGLGIARLIHDYMTGEMTPRRETSAFATAVSEIPAMNRINYPSGSLGTGEFPVGGSISSEFGLREHPITGKLSFHEGLDIAAPVGSPVRVVDSGTVAYSGRQRGYGNIVVVRHASGVETAYAHNSKNLVEVGDRVAAGDTIALVGSTGASTGPHVHFEVRVGDEKMNPLVYMKTSVNNK